MRRNEIGMEIGIGSEGKGWRDGNRCSRRMRRNERRLEIGIGCEGKGGRDRNRSKE